MYFYFSNLSMLLQMVFSVGSVLLLKKDLSTRRSCCFHLVPTAHGFRLTQRVTQQQLKLHAQLLIISWCTRDNVRFNKLLKQKQDSDTQGLKLQSSSFPTSQPCRAAGRQQQGAHSDGAPGLDRSRGSIEGDRSVLSSDSTQT